MIRPRGETALDVIACCPHLAALHEDHGEQLMHGWMIRIASQQTLAGCFGLVKPPSLVIADGLD